MDGTAAVYRERVNAKRRDATFLVRMWLTGELGGDEQWRGSVHEVSSGKRLFVTDAREIAEFIAVQLAEARSNSR